SGLPRNSVHIPAIRPSRIRASVREALSLLDVRRRLPDLHSEDEAASRESFRIWPLALRRAQRREQEIGEARVRLLTLGAKVADGLEGWPLRLSAELWRAPSPIPTGRFWNNAVARRSN